MKTKFLLILPALILLWPSCSREIYCPFFNPEILEWLPYQAPDVLTFTNAQNNDTLRLYVNEVTVTHDYSWDTGTDCANCGNAVIISGTVNGTGTLYARVEMYLNGNLIDKYTLSNSGFDSDDCDNCFLDTTYEMNGFNYEPVRIFNEPSNSQFIQIVIAKGYGIISLTTYKGIVWQLIDRTNENIPETVAIINTGCGGK